MKREIIFRGKDESGKWLYGNFARYTEDDGKHVSCIVGNRRNDVDACVEFTQVDPDTIGQFTGLIDKNDMMIFEGDIVCKRDLTFGLRYKGVVVYNSAIGCFRIHSENNGIKMRMGFEASDVYNDGKCTVPVKYDYEVIGNIHDNKDLL